MPDVILIFSSDCEKFFGLDSLKPIVNDDDVTCTTQFSKVVPLEGGEVSLSGELVRADLDC